MTPLYKTLLRLLLPLILITYVGGQTWFAHVHRVGGEVIVHTHPYKQEQHSHTAGQLETIVFLTQYLLPELTLNAVLLPAPVFLWRVTRRPALGAAAVKAALSRQAARAPPCQ